MTYSLCHAESAAVPSSARDPRPREAGVVTLRVGTFASLGSRVLPRAVAELQARFSVRVEVIEAEPTDVVRMLRTGEVHAGLIYEFSVEPAFDLPDLRLRRILSAAPKRTHASRGTLKSIPDRHRAAGAAHS